MSRARHPDKHIDEVVRFAESIGWRVELSSGHCWGRLLCPRRDRDGCQFSVWSTPRNAENHAHQIMRRVEQCGHERESPPSPLRGEDDERRS